MASRTVANTSNPGPNSVATEIHLIFLTDYIGSRIKPSLSYISVFILKEKGFFCFNYLPTDVYSPQQIGLNWCAVP